MSIFRAQLIAAAVLAMTPSATFAQVRVITGDTEHVYGPGGQLLDDAEPGSGLSTGPGGGLSTGPGGALLSGPGGGLYSGPGGALSSGPCGGLSTGPACKLEK